jgi:hypothetical protein
MEQITYADVWNVGEQRPERMLTEAEARARHDAGERYSVLIGDGETTEMIHTIELAIGMITSRFLDAHRRVCMMRLYAQRAGDRLFLEWTAFYNYADDDPRGTRIIVAETTDFRTDGTWNELVRYRDGDEASTGTIADISDHWEPIPAFGDYARISRYV